MQQSGWVRGRSTGTAGRGRPGRCRAVPGGSHVAQEERAHFIESAMLGCMVDPLEAPLLQWAASMQRVWAFVSARGGKARAGWDGPSNGSTTRGRLSEGTDAVDKIFEGAR